MSRLRDLINQSKGQPNGQAQPVLQPEAAKKETIIETPVQGTVSKPAGSLPDRARQNQTSKPPATSDNRLLEQKGSATITEAIKAVVALAPPPGLSGLALIRWRKENATAPRTSAVVDNASQNSVQTVAKTPSTVEGNVSPQPTGLVVQSASQSADAQKTNDGVANIAELKQNLTYLAANLENRDLVAQVVRTIATQIKNNPALQGGMSDPDVNLMIRGMRAAYHTAAMKKQEKADGKKKSNKAVDEVTAMFKEAGLTLNLKG